MSVKALRRTTPKKKKGLRATSAFINRIEWNGTWTGYDAMALASTVEISEIGARAIYMPGFLNCAMMWRTERSA